MELAQATLIELEEYRYMINLILLFLITEKKKTKNSMDQLMVSLKIIRISRRVKK